MISAAKFFHEKKNDDDQNEQDGFFRWNRQSASCCRVERNGHAEDPDPTDDWMLELESYLTTLTGGCAKPLLLDRNDLVVSAPLRLCPKTLTHSLLAPTPKGPFSMAGLSMGGADSGALEFYSYIGHDNRPRQEAVPRGYEEVEAVARVHEEKKEESNKGAASSVFFIMEIQYRTPRIVSPNTVASTSLTEIGLIWNNSNIDNGNPLFLSKTSANGIKVKLISSHTLLQVLQKQNLYASQETLSWVLSELHDAENLALPQPVGDGVAQPSLLLLVSLDPSTAGPHGSNRFAANQTNIKNGHIALKFHQHEQIKTPLSNQLSSAVFLIGRQVQVVHHPSSEEEDTQKALQAALCNAVRFIPEWKRRQWDIAPNVLIMVLPHPNIPFNIAQWLRRPQVRRSHFDPALGNLLLHLPYGQQWTPPNTYYIDSHTTVNPAVWRDIKLAHDKIVQVLGNIKANAVHYDNVPPGGDSIMNQQALYNLCVTAESGNHTALRHQLQHCVRIEQGYLSRMLTALMIERLRCFEDMKKHDMYSIHWKDHIVEIPPPLHPVPTCPGCSPAQRSIHLCAFHLALTHVKEETGRHPMPGKPIAIRTKRQLERLPLILWTMSPDDSLVVKITVPGVAEDFPLISIGDMVRLLFVKERAYPLSTEIVAEVVDVVVKSEVVTIRLPSPLHHQSGRKCPTIGCLPYLQALLHSKDYYLDAEQVLHSPAISLAKPIAVENRNEVLDRFRFDIRFGFQGSLGFDIIEAVLGTFLTPIKSPIIHFRPTGTKSDMKKNEQELNDLNGDEARKEKHLHRLLAPTKSFLGNIVLTGERKYRLLQETIPPLNFSTEVNHEQQQAIEDIVYGYHGDAPYIIEGPAGTGKSLCICEAIVQILRTYYPAPKVLVCAPSDAACDVLAARLLRLLPTQSLLRVNWWSRKVASVKPELLSSCPMDVVGGAFSIPSLDELTQADVIVCQCFVAECLELAGPAGWTKKHFTHLFIDETSQAMECEALIPMAKVGFECSIVLAGDPKQLGPTVRDPVAAKMGLNVSIQERLLNLPLYRWGHYCVKTLLVKNYRSNEALLTVPSNLFYGGNLESMAPQEVTDPFENLGDLGPSGFPLLLCNVPNGLERSKLDTPSFYNLEECNAVVSLAQGLLRCKSKVGVQPLHTGQISVITPFRAQVLALRTILRASNLGGINVGVVEDFQGQEAKVVFISTVLTRDHQRWNSTDFKGDNPGRRLGFLHDPKRFNVAITRAHALCVIVGHAEYLEQSGTYWAALMDHIKRNDGVLGEELDEEDGSGHENDGDDVYGVADLLRRVHELKLLGPGVEEDLTYYYSDVPQWKVMLT